MNVVCIKYGNRYSADYVNKLYSMVARHLHEPFKFYCYTDKSNGIREEVLTRPLYYAFDPAWWDKLWLFRPMPELCDDYILAIDLDVVITNSLDFLTRYTGNFCGLRDWGRKDRWNGSLWLLKPGQMMHVWDRFIDNAFATMNRLYADQDWLGEQIPQADDFETLYPGAVVGFRNHYWATGGSEEERVFDNMPSIYVFHGLPKPHEVASVKWIKEHWR